MDEQQHANFTFTVTEKHTLFISLNKILYKRLKHLNYLIFQWVHFLFTPYIQAHIQVHSLSQTTVLVPPKRLTECISVAWLLSARRQMTKFTEAETDFTSKLNVRWSVWPKIHSGAKSYEECWVMLSGGRERKAEQGARLVRQADIICRCLIERRRIQMKYKHRRWNINTESNYSSARASAWDSLNFQLHKLEIFLCRCWKQSVVCACVTLCISWLLSRHGAVNALKLPSAFCWEKPHLLNSSKWRGSEEPVAGRKSKGSWNFQREMMRDESVSVWKQSVWVGERESLHQRVWDELLRNLLITDQAPPSFEREMEF